MPVWTLSKEFTFEAAHKLETHDGKCARLHGHSWKMLVTAKGDALQEEGPKEGMLIDYSDLKKMVKPIVDDYLDHHYLNETLDMDMPTSEKVAQWVFLRLKELYPNFPLSSVTIFETCTSACVYEQ